MTIPVNTLGDDFISFPAFQRQLRQLERALVPMEANQRDYWTRNNKARRLAVRKRLRKAFYRRKAV